MKGRFQRKVLAVLMIMVMTLGTVAGISAYQANASTEGLKATSIIKDKNLEKVIRETIKKPKGTLTQKDLNRVKVLKAGSKGIKSTAGIENCGNLVYLDLSGNKLTEINSIYAYVGATEGLSKLKELYLSKNKIKKIYMLATINSLTKLDLSQNALDSISDLGNLTNLEELRINNNQISDISVLSAFAKLKLLHMEDNKIVELTPIAGLKNLRELYLMRNPVKDLYQLEGIFPKLEKKDFELGVGK